MPTQAGDGEIASLSHRFEAAAVKTFKFVFQSPLKANMAPGFALLMGHRWHEIQMPSLANIEPLMVSTHTQQVYLIPQWLSCSLLPLEIQLRLLCLQYPLQMAANNLRLILEAHSLTAFFGVDLSVLTTSILGK
ncbi:hypothetical protein [Andreprevotia sp. IGB-42]|uniref:hypothetical protein n=1 Tax=Andreprevotia sp. IGB-42 TaxID=2497473 RepID=UPI00135B5154|nr:hypothetical protein [Andreprevotia sp. IGB-42]